MQGRYEGLKGEEHKFNHGRNGIGMLFGGIGIGALLMYLFDPDRGQGRRAKLGDQLTSKVNHLKGAAGSKARDLRNRAQGVMHEFRGSLLPKAENVKQSHPTSDSRGSSGHQSSF
jgi:gas vesicle protein